MMRDILAITLDLDDTLWPLRPTLLQAERELAQWLAGNAPATAALLNSERRAQLRAQVLQAHAPRAHDVSFVRREVLRAALREAGEAPDLAEPAFQVFLTARQQVSLYPDVLPVLTRWASRYRLVAISNGNANLDQIGLGGLFSAMLSAQDFAFAKPDPRIFHEACRRIGVEPDKVLHVGDDLHLDVLAAQAAGLRSAWIRRPDLVDARPVSAGAVVPEAFVDLHALEMRLADS